MRRRTTASRGLEAEVKARGWWWMWVGAGRGGGGRPWVEATEGARKTERLV
jgi:hypothetical protein